MTSYLSSLLTTTTSRVAYIQQNLLTSENDGNTEDNTHICRVLRAYYTEKGRAFPAWLPPDPKAPPPVVVQPVYSQPTVGSRYGGLQNQDGAAGGGPLSSLWDSQPQAQQAQPDSLRQGRGTPNRPVAGQSAQRQNPFARQQASQEPQIQARPLPSQRAGSYQTAGASTFGRDTPPGSSGAGSAQDRLKSRLNLRQGQAPGSRMADAVQQVQRNNSYGSSASGGSGGNYDGRATPSGSGYGGGGGAKPFVAATSPWASSESEFGGGGYGNDSGGGSQGRSGRGLPNGPAAGKRGPGLPSGPRGPR